MKRLKVVIAICDDRGFFVVYEYPNGTRIRRRVQYSRIYEGITNG